ncbi:unnamed protein product [Ambrosiozyma monospora]|uniref:Unnamed protein product n=1 Tax=Ambrosiozyma monospora TaxID=43982 RepID=A0A9W6YYA3_AMBMO|nr:unnamed protein product [Ambrosiozyma monospora]
MTNYFNIKTKLKDSGDEWFSQPTCDEYIHSHLRKYQSEVRSYKLIEKFNETHKAGPIHVPRLIKHGYCCIELKSGALIEGVFLALEYLPFVKNKKLNDISGIIRKLESIGIHHNDLKKRNMCVDEKGRTFIYDFGEAVVDSDSLPSSSETEKTLVGELKDHKIE